MPEWLMKILPIFILLILVGIVLWRLPKVEIEHSKAFRRRRFFNWFPLGMTYAFLYFGRYNLTVAKTELPSMTNEDFGTIFMWGAITYGCAFVLNGPLCDRFGGRKTLIAGTIGSMIMNLIMGYVIHTGQFDDNLTVVLSILFSGNMYFQSFGAVSIVKVNSAWFHVRERGVLGGIFGILISLGVYFAYDWNGMILDEAVFNLPPQWVFFIPAAVIGICFFFVVFVIRDSPSEAGFEDFDVGDASSGDDGPRLPVWQVAKKMVTNPVILTIAAIEFCSGYLRNAVMQWGKIFPSQTGLADDFVFANWGMMQCAAGIMAGMFAGVISDYVFKSRRGPVATILYLGMVLGGVGMFFTLETPAIGWNLIFIVLCVVGVHGMLSGTASMDFGGRKNAGVAVGLIDACVYLGTAVQAKVLGSVLPSGDAAADISNWSNWPIAIVPVAIIGTVLALRIWNSKPQGKGGH